MIVADTGAVVALVDADDRHHRALRRLFEDEVDAWVLPWAVLPEVDYVLGSHVGGALRVAWGEDADLDRARKLHQRYRGLNLGLVDGTVIAIAERMKAEAIATLDLRHFGAVAIHGKPRLLPRDLA